jgi:hypothetical protein
MRIGRRQVGLHRDEVALDAEGGATRAYYVPPRATCTRLRRHRRSPRPTAPQTDALAEVLTLPLYGAMSQGRSSAWPTVTVAARAGGRGRRHDPPRQTLGARETR